jgi:CopA family copper-resistance protein
MDNNGKGLNRRRFLKGMTAMGLLAGIERVIPAYAAAEDVRAIGVRGLPRKENVIDLSIHEQSIGIAGREATATAINGTVPGPLVRLREGETFTLNVRNQLKEASSIHWHGVLVPTGMDGVPGVSFAGIAPGETFAYQFPVGQSGTYWYHSHSGLQEQTGVYGPIIIDPAKPDPFRYDRDYVIMLSDWTFEDPHRVIANLKKYPGYYNFQRLTAGDFLRDVKAKGWSAALDSRLEWARMRMDPTDISDITGYTYTYLMNGLPPVSNWSGLFKPGERVRLRFINAGAASYFDIRIPGLKMTVVQADGQNVKPVTVDEFRIAIAETYDVIVQPAEDRAYTVFAEAMDRSGYACGTLAPRPGMSAPIPPRRPRPIRTMMDMGMSDMKGMDMSIPSDKGSDMKGMDMGGAQQKPDHAGHDISSGTAPASSAPAASAVAHGTDTHGPGNSSTPTVTKSRLDEPGDGLENTGTRVLVYTDLQALKPFYDQREPARELELHLTGNMDKYMWSFDGKQFWEVKGPIPFRYGERLRLTLVNDTMMEHPIHLHGMWMTLDNGTGEHRPLKHTLNVKPAERLSVLITADALGQWAFHCHILYHMEMGMFRVVEVSKRDPGGTA